MAAIFTRPSRESDVVMEDPHFGLGLSRVAGTVTVTSGMTIGAVLGLVAGVWVHTAIATVGDAKGVLIDASVAEAQETPGDYTLTVLQGPAPSMVAREALSYADAVSEANKTTAEESLTDKSNIVIGTRKV